MYSALKIFIEKTFVDFEEDHCSWIDVHEVLYSYLPSYSVTVVAAVPVVGVVVVSSVTVMVAVPVVGVVVVSEPVKKGGKYLQVPVLL